MIFNGKLAKATALDAGLGAFFSLHAAGNGGFVESNSTFVVSNGRFAGSNDGSAEGNQRTVAGTKEL